MFFTISASTRIPAVLLCGLGLFVLTGWAIGSETMVRLIPGSVAMSINTAAMFLAGGVALALACSAGRRARKVHLALAWLLVVLPLAILSQHVFDIDLGIDWAAVHAALGDGHAKPGRTAPNACLGFLLSGIAMLLGPRAARQRPWYLLSLLLCVFTFVIGLTAFLGYLLSLDMLYQFASYNRMAALTALGMTTLGTGVWSLIATRCNPDTSRERNEAQRVTTLAAILLVVFALATGVAAFGLLKDSFERSVASNIVRTTRTTAISVSALLDKALRLSQSVASRPGISEALVALARNPRDAAALRQLDNEGANLLALEFSAVRFENPAGELLASQGVLLGGQAHLRVPIGTPEQASDLLWNNGYLIRSEHAVFDNGVLVGRMVLENRLPAFTAFLAEAQMVAASSDVVLCARDGRDAVCFPSRFYRTSQRYPLFKPNGKPLYPITRALEGETGSAIVKDPRGTSVLAGYTALPKYQLGMIEKIDVVELYAPLRARLPYLILVVLAFVTGGTLLLSRWVRPLVAQIAAERHRIKLVLDHSNDAFFAVDATGRISDWNLEAERILGWTAAEAIGRDLAAVVVPAGDGGAFAQLMSQGAGEALSHRIETRALHKSGREIPVEVSVATFDTGNGYAASAFLRDLTRQIEAANELEAARAALAQSQKLEAVGKLTGGVAHDFNNVLQVVKGSLQLLQVENGYNFKVQKRVETASKAVDRGAKLAAQLLAFARKQPLQPKVINIGRVVTGMGEMLQRALGESVEIETVVSAGLWSTLADRNQLEQVILNLAINARDAMAGEGRLTIEVANAHLQDEYVRTEPGLKAGQYVMVAVSDTGCGMTPEVRERVFEPFFTTKPEGMGTGLGLSMAYGFVKQSDGHIGVYSEPGHGTTIKVYLPRSFEKEEIEPAAPALAVEGGRETILVVEDDLSVQETAVDLLSGLGYKVIRADNAGSALAMLEQGAVVDLLFTDVVMPGPVRSPELAARAQQLLPDLKVLFTSGYTQNAIVHGGRLDPGVHLLSKPYGREELARKVRELLGSAATAPAAASPKIAFVEDNDDFRALGTELLLMLGFQVDSFASAEHASAALAGGGYDILLTDITLPGMSGLELADQAYHCQPALRIVFASGHGSELTPKPGFPHAVLTKPFVLDDLKNALRIATTDAVK